ncbi:MAG: SDR family oxidoreductase, partial [Candidatus Sungbacteria bacterium]|nr:SDR family oxidoreductase [Candidatus Sungbacteria bacterium]
MPKRVLIFGSDGMLGSEFMRRMKKDPRYLVFGCGRKCADITRLASVAAVIRKRRPDVIINCAAKINVDRCEAEPLEAWLVNAIGPGNIIHALAKLGLSNALFVHISTSDVFGEGRKKFWSVDDSPHPVNVYGWSKLGGEKITAAEARMARMKYFIVRTAWLYSRSKNTFIDTVADSIIRRKAINIASDQFNLPTEINNLVSGVMFLMD